MSTFVTKDRERMERCCESAHKLGLTVDEMHELISTAAVVKVRIKENNVIQRTLHEWKCSLLVFGVNLFDED